MYNARMARMYIGMARPARPAHDKRILNESGYLGTSLAGPAIYVDKASETTWGRSLASPAHYRGYIREQTYF